MLIQTLQQLQLTPPDQAHAQRTAAHGLSLGARVELPHSAPQALQLLEAQRDSAVMLSESPGMAMREHLYSLADIRSAPPLSDLGALPLDIAMHPSIIEQLVDELDKMGHTLLLVGAERNPAPYMLQGLKTRRNSLSMCAISHGMGLEPPELGGGLSEIVENADDKLLHDFCLMGHQVYYTSAHTIQAIRNKHFDLIRLGHIRADHRDAEPTFRGSDAVSIDLRAVWASDCPCHFLPNGLHAEEICQLARYAGGADRVAAIALHGLPSDAPAQVHSLAAQIVWHLIEGISLRRHEHPTTTPSRFKRFIVSTSPGTDLIFYRSNQANTWWMELHPAIQEKTTLIPCSPADYTQACQQAPPERWLRSISRVQRNNSLPKQPNEG